VAVGGVKSPQLEAALRAAGRGWRVFPIVERGKRPLVKWQTEATCDPGRLRYWWSGPWQYANLGAVVPDATVVLDVDPRHDGDLTLEALEARHGALPGTLTDITGSGGWHSWFHVADADQLRQDANVLGPGVDTRCAGRGYLVIPPSVHPCGGTYRWGRGTKTTADAPGWLVERLQRPPEQTLRSLPDSQPWSAEATSRYGRRALDSEIDRVLHTSLGRRNNSLYLASVRAGQLVEAGHLHVLEAIAVLTSAARTIHLDEREIDGTVRSGITFGRAHPRGR
jgi:hypothetical protein